MCFIEKLVRFFAYRWSIGEQTHAFRMRIIFTANDYYVFDFHITDERNVEQKFGIDVALHISFSKRVETCRSHV